MRLPRIRVGREIARGVVVIWMGKAARLGWVRGRAMRGFVVWIEVSVVIETTVISIPITFVGN